MKRRISANKTNLALPVAQVDDDDDDVRSVTSASSRRRSLGGRRRSSFGSHASKTVVSAVEQNRIAEMYKTVIKMSSENKITMKNSWSYDLIDHMGNLIRDESTGQRGINFQKASCTLDASVKIYSNRVDDTHASSQRILDSLSRTYTNGDGDGEGQQRGAARVGSKNASSKLNIAETIEKDVDNLNAPKVETLQAADPMFHKMSKAFDDGGAKGMLMANLRVSQTECALVFAAAQLQDEAVAPIEAAAVPPPASAPAGSTNGVVDISDLIFKCGFDAQSLLSLTVCPALEGYRRTIGVSETTAGAFDLNDFPAYFPAVLVGPPSEATDDTGVSNSAGTAFAPVAVGAVGTYDDTGFDGPDAYGDDGDDDNDYGGNDNDFPSNDGDDAAPYAAASAPSRTSLGAAVARRTTLDAESHKIQWLAEAPAASDADTGASSSEVDAAAAADAVVWDSAGITSTNDYSFFDLEAISKSNSWAGARHWKYATRKTAALDRVARLPATAEEDEHEEAAAGAGEGKDGASSAGGGGEDKTGAKKSEKKEKDKFVFDFRGALVAEDAFAVPSAKSRGGDVTCLTAAALEKDAAAGAEGALFLPPDAKLQTSDLCRLMMCGNIIVPPPMLAHAFIKQVNAAAASSSSRPAQRAARTGLYSSSVQGPDVIWGQVRKVTAPAGATFSGAFGQAAANWGRDDDMGDDHDDHDGGDFGEDFCDGDNDYDGPATTDATSKPEPEGLYINTDALLRAPRMVEKIDIGFATTAKRVNVKKLKTDIWSHIDELPVASLSAEEDGENQSPNAGATEGDAADGKATDKLSFQELVREIASEQKQKDVTLPFYFICLLHLANEKTLKIEGSPFMDNLVISKDMKI